MIPACLQASVPYITNHGAARILVSRLYESLSVQGSLFTITRIGLTDTYMVAYSRQSYFLLMHLKNDNLPFILVVIKVSIFSRTPRSAIDFHTYKITIDQTLCLFIYFELNK